MNIVKHNWNGSAIAQLNEDTKISKHNVPSGYVNATQMCQACGKLWGHYSSLDSTKAFMQGLSADIGIPISGLTIIIKGGNDKQSQGTWVHPEIAIDLAQWVSVEFRIWANRTLRKLMSGEIPATSQPKPNEITPEELINITAIALSKSSLSQDLQTTYLLRGIEAKFPNSKELVREILPGVQPKTEEEYVSPTRLAQIFNKSHQSKVKAYQMGSFFCL